MVMEQIINKVIVANRIMKLINATISRYEVDEYFEILAEVLKFPEFWFRRIYIHGWLENKNKFNINKIRKI